MQYGDKCSEPYALSGEEPVSLCCQKEISNQSEGDCRMCRYVPEEYVNKRDNGYHWIGS